MALGLLFSYKTSKIHNNSIDKNGNVVYNSSMKEKKYFIDAVLEKEKQRNENMRLAYEKRILELPKGSLVIRVLNGKKYCYLRFREEKKVVQKYAGTIEQEEIIRAQIAERKHLIELITMLEEENKRIKKMEAVK
jgi:hypothetical protein